MFIPQDLPLLRSWICNRVYFVYQQTSGGQTAFSSSDDYWQYLSRLFLLAHRYQVRVHAYALLPSHVRLLLEPRRHWSISRLMQHLQSGYARWKHRQQGRDGHLWKHHFGAQVVPRSCYRHAMWSVEESPVFLGLARTAVRYRWSSARIHASGPGAGRRIPLRGSGVSWRTIDLYWRPGYEHWTRYPQRQRRMFGGPDPQAWRFRFARVTSSEPENRTFRAAATPPAATPS
jgi:REP element-mobilizing transposase RayT